MTVGGYTLTYDSFNTYEHRTRSAWVRPSSRSRRTGSSSGTVAARAGVLLQQGSAVDPGRPQHHPGPRRLRLAARVLTETGKPRSSSRRRQSPGELAVDRRHRHGVRRHRSPSGPTSATSGAWRPAMKGRLDSMRSETGSAGSLARSSPPSLCSSACWSVSVLALPASATAGHVVSVSDKLMCLCGCNSVLTECARTRTASGASRPSSTSPAAGRGQSPDALVDYYVAKYGEQVLAAPTKTRLQPGRPGSSPSSCSSPAGWSSTSWWPAGCGGRAGPAAVAGPGTMEPVRGRGSGRAAPPAGRGTRQVRLTA